MPSLTFSMPSWRMRAHSVRRRRRRDRRNARTAHEQIADLVGQRHHLVQTDPPTKAGPAAAHAPDRLEQLGPFQAVRGEHLRRRRRFSLAVGAQRAGKSLGNHTVDRGARP